MKFVLYSIDFIVQCENIIEQFLLPRTAPMLRHRGPPRLGPKRLLQLFLRLGGVQGGMRGPILMLQTKSR